MPGENGEKTGNPRLEATALLVSLGVVLVMFLGGCAARQPPALLDVPAFAGDAGTTELPAAEQFLAIDDDMRALVTARLGRVRDPLDRLQRLSRLLLDPEQLGIRYDSELTLPAREAYRQRAANCLSFSALLVAMAREAGLDARFQDVPVLPTWRLAGRVFLVERHVNTLVRVASRKFVVDFRPPDAASWSRAKIIGDANAIAQYFGNLGVEQLTDDNPGTAYRLFRRGLEVDPRAASLWINIGVALARNGQLQEAGQSYRQALALDPRNLSALGNLAGVAELQGEREQASALRARVERLRRKNPYFMYAQGEYYLHSGEYPQALAAFRAAVRKAPKEGDFHFALARVHRALGDTKLAARSYGAALERAASDSVRQRYRARYEAGAD
ncbi:MAG: tetratricopeptide repeat protein [Gammaproteobacteria bacterium]|nr:tetratricopeptide repeat protein [Gammaproteobacteria bacterium]